MPSLFQQPPYSSSLLFNVNQLTPLLLPPPIPRPINLIQSQIRSYSLKSTSVPGSPPSSSLHRPSLYNNNLIVFLSICSLHRGVPLFLWIIPCSLEAFAEFSTLTLQVLLLIEISSVFISIHQHHQRFSTTTLEFSCNSVTHSEILELLPCHISIMKTKNSIFTSIISGYQSLHLRN